MYELTYRFICLFIGSWVVLLVFLNMYSRHWLDYFFSSHQVGHSEDTGAAYASTAAAAHGKKKTKYSGEWTRDFLILPWFWWWYVLCFSLKPSNMYASMFSFGILCFQWLQMFSKQNFSPTVESVVITPFLPVVAFGRPLPKLTPQ